MMNKQLRVAIIGCGRISDLHARGYEGLDTARITVACDANKKRAEEQAHKWGAARVYTDYQQVLADTEVDVVEILLPHHLHARVAIEALAAAKHVSLQKPMCTTLAEADEIVRAVRQARGRFRLYENFIFYPPYQKAKELIAAGEIGKLQMICLHVVQGSEEASWEVPLTSQIWRFQENKSGGGPLTFDDGFHKFSLAWDFMGAVEEVRAWIDKSPAMKGPIPVPGFNLDAPATIMWQHAARRRYGMMDVSYAPKMRVESEYYAIDERVEIVGSAGIIWINRCTARTVDRPAVEMFCKGETFTYDDMPQGWEQGFINCTRHFIAAIRNNSEVRLSATRGRDLMRFALAVKKSAERDGAAVCLSDM